MDHRQAGPVPDENHDHPPAGEQHPPASADLACVGLWPRMALRWIDPPRRPFHV